MGIYCNRKSTCLQPILLHNKSVYSYIQKVNAVSEKHITCEHLKLLWHHIIFMFLVEKQYIKTPFVFIKVGCIKNIASEKLEKLLLLKFKYTGNSK